MSRYIPILGPYQGITISSTPSYSTSLAPGKYALEAEGASAHVNRQTNNSTPAAVTHQRVTSGTGRYFEIPPDGQTYYLAVVVSGSGTGTIHLNKVG